MNVKFLGIHVENNLKCLTNIDHIRCKLNKGIFMLINLRDTASKDVIIIIYFDYVYSLISYRQWNNILANNSLYKLLICTEKDCPINLCCQF